MIPRLKSRGIFFFDAFLESFSEVDEILKAALNGNVFLHLRIATALISDKILDFLVMLIVTLNLRIEALFFNFFLTVEK